MIHRYHDSFPAAPQALVSGLAAACQIPVIVGARVGKGDGSVYLDVIQDDDFHVDLRVLSDIAEFFEVEEEEVRVENGPRADTITVTVCSSNFDFSACFRKPLPGEEDSEESVEASVALSAARRR
jgi:hypothetical protein